MPSSLILELSRSDHAYSGSAWWYDAMYPSSLLCSGNVVWQCFAPDMNQVIQRKILCQLLCQMQLELRYLAIRLLQSLEHQPILVGCAHCMSLPDLNSHSACIKDLISTQLILWQCSVWLDSLYYYQDWCCNAYQLKAMSRVASGIISSANVIISSVTSCLGQEHCLWPGSTLIVLMTGGTKPEVLGTRILTINCCAWASG